MTKTGNETREIASQSQVAAAVAAMTAADRVRLSHFARLRAAGLKGVDWEDLLHEAIDRALAGSRKWPTSVPFIAFMCGSIRSIASEHWRSSGAAQEVLESDLAAAGTDDRPVLDAADEHPGPEREAVAREMLARVFDLFEGDNDAIAVLNGLANGHSPDEIQRANMMSSTKYASTQKKIRRRISRSFKESSR